MDIKAILLQRSEGCCELCGADNGLEVYQIEPVELAVSECQIIACQTCYDQIDKKAPLDEEHWKCLIQCSRSDYTSVQVVSWRQLQRLSHLDWAKEVLKSLKFDEVTHEWALAGL